MNRQTLPGMIRDLLTTGSPGSRQENLEWLCGIINSHAPEGWHLEIEVEPEGMARIHDLGTCYLDGCGICATLVVGA